MYLLCLLQSNRCFKGILSFGVLFDNRVGYQRHTPCSILAPGFSVNNFEVEVVFLFVLPHSLFWDERCLLVTGIYCVLWQGLGQNHGPVWDVCLTELQAPEMFVKFR